MKAEENTTPAPQAPGGVSPHEQLLQAIWDHSLDALLLTAPDGRIFAANPAACSLFGRTEADICHVGRNALLDATDPHLAEALAERARTGGTRRELTLIRADGSRFPGEVTSAVFTDQDGQVRTSMIIRDITERHRTAELIREQALFPLHNPGPVLRVDARGLIVTANPAACAAGLVVGARFQDSFPATRDLGLPNSTDRGKPCVFEAELGAKCFQFTILGDPALGQLLVYGTDITTRKQAETALRESEAQYHSLFENMFSGFVLMEVLFDAAGQPVDHRLLQANAEFDRMTGLKRSEEIGRTSATLGFKWPPKVSQEFYQVALGGPPLHGERFNESLQRYYDRRVFSPRHGQFAMLFTDITARKQAEDELRQSERRFATIFRASPSAIGISRLSDGIFLDVNDAFVQLYGYPRTEIVGHSSAELRLWQSANRAAVMREVGAKHCCQVIELQGRRKDGEIRDLLAAVETIELAGEPCIVGILTDITDRKQAEAALRQSEQKFRAIFDLAPVGISLLNAEHHLIDANPALEKIMQLTKADLLAGKHRLRRFVRSDGTPVRLEEWPSERAFREQRAVHGIELGTVTEEGRTIWMQINAAPLNPDSGSSVVITQDITAHKEAEAALRDSEELFSTTFHASPIPVSITNLASGKWIEVNEAFLLVTGYAREEVIGHTFQDIHLWKGPAEREKLMSILNTQGCVSDFEVEINKKGGTTGTMLLSVETIELAGKPSLLIMGIEITARKEAEAALQRSRSLLALAEQIGKVGAWELDVESGKVTWTEAVYQILEVEPACLPSLENALDFYTAASRPIIARAVQRASELGEPIDVELELVTARGHHRSVHVMSQTDRVQRKVQGFFQDITARKEAEAAVRETEQRLRVGLALANIAVFNQDLALRYTWMYQPQLGYTLKEVVGRTDFDLLPGAAAEQATALKREALASQQVTRGEIRVETSSGTKSYDLIVEPLRNAAGEVIGITGASLDVTEREQTAAALRQSEERLHLVMEATRDGIWDWNLRTDLTYLSPRYYELTGYQPGEFTPDFAFFKRLVHPEDFPLVLEKMTAHLQGLTEQSLLDYRLVTKTGVIRWVFGRGRVVERDATGAPLRMVGTVTDITDRKQVEADLAASQTALRALAARLQSAREEERQRIARRVHDDLGHAFTDLKLDLAWLDRRLAERKLTRRAAARQKIAAMIQRVEADLNTTRTLSADLRPAVLDTLGLVAALEWAAQQFESRLHIPCTLELPADFPPLATDRAAALFRAFEEILSNVARHAGATRVRVCLAAAAGRVTLEVSDNGRGITAAERDDPGAIGLLGLRERALEFGGTVEIEGAPGQGTRVRVSIPAGTP